MEGTPRERSAIGPGLAAVLYRTEYALRIVIVDGVRGLTMNFSLRMILFLATCLVVMLRSDVAAQVTRAELILAADVEIEDGLAIARLGLAADPALGPPDSMWARGMLHLTERLLATGEDSLMVTWLRWGVRLTGEREWEFDPLEYAEEAVVAYRAIRAELLGSIQRDTPHEVSWSWLAGARTGLGAMRIDVTDTASDVVLRVGGRVVGRGDSVILDPGTYRIQADAVGFETAEFSREVLPDVTTVVALHLTADPLSGVEVTERQSPGGNGGFPTAIAVGGVAGAVGVVAALVVLFGGGDPIPETGVIRVPLPGGS